jgi:hypothetical protein
MSPVEFLRPPAAHRGALDELGMLVRELLSDLGSAHAGRAWPEDRPARERCAREEHP